MIVLVTQGAELSLTRALRSGLCDRFSNWQKPRGMVRPQGSWSSFRFQCQDVAVLDSSVCCGFMIISVHPVIRLVVEPF